MDELHADALLCETCGYPMGGIADQPVCPECGRAIAASLPGHRKGSAWQRRASMRSFFETSLASLAAPVRTAESVVFDVPRADRVLMVLHCAAAALILALTFVGHAGSNLVPAVVNRTAVRDDVGVAIESLVLTFLGAGAVAFAALFGLTQIERLGYRFIGKRRGWRVRGEITRAVCAHASVYWIVAAGLAPLGWVVARMLEPVAAHVPGMGAEFARVALSYLPAGGFVLGVVVFEVVVYRGMRACRYAAVADAPGAKRREA